LGQVHVEVGQDRLGIHLQRLAVVNDRLRILARRVENVADIDVALLHSGVQLQRLLVFAECLFEVATVLVETAEQETIDRVFRIAVDQLLQREDVIRVVFSPRGGQRAPHAGVRGHPIDRDRHTIGRYRQRRADDQQHRAESFGAPHEAKGDHDPIQCNPPRREPEQQRQEEHGPAGNSGPALVHELNDPLLDLVPEGNVVTGQHQQREHQHAASQREDQDQGQLVEETQIPDRSR
jgi:hypothetical protein